MIKKAFHLFKSQKQIHNLMIYGVGQGFNLITPLLVVPFLISVCGVANFGKTSIAMAITFFLMVFIDYGCEIIGVKSAAIYRENKIQLEKIFVNTIASKCVLLVVTIVAVSILFVVIPFFKAEQSLYFFCIPILIAQCFNPTWFLQGLEEFKWITTLTIISKIFYLVAIFLFINQKSDYIFVNLFWGIGNLLGYGLVFVYTIKKHQFSFLKTQKAEVISILKNNFSFFLSQIFVSLQMYAPIMLLGFIGNNFLAGQYKIIEQIIVVFKTYLILFFNFLYPRVCYLIETNVKLALQFWKNYNGLNFLFIILSMVFLFCFSDDAISYFTKKEITETSKLLQLAVAIPILMSISLPLKQLLLGFNKQKIYVRNTMIMVVLNLAVMAFLIPIYKINGVLISLIITEICTMLVYYFNLKSNVFKQH